jgi:hypothetical protein
MDTIDEDEVVLAVLALGLGTLRLLTLLTSNDILNFLLG